MHFASKLSHSVDGRATSDSSLTLLLTYEMQLPLGRQACINPWGVFSIFIAGHALMCLEIVKLKLDWSYLATPAECWQPGKAAVRLLPFSHKE